MCTGGCNAYLRRHPAIADGGGYDRRCRALCCQGCTEIKKKVDKDPSVKPLIGLISAAVFVISSLPLPAPSGTSAHPTAIAIAAIILGPWAAAAVTGVVLIMQALFMAHGGVTAWGANTLDMGVFGGFVAYGVYVVARRTNAPLWLGLGWLARLATSSPTWERR